MVLIGPALFWTFYWIQIQVLYLLIKLIIMIGYWFTDPRLTQFIRFSCVIYFSNRKANWTELLANVLWYLDCSTYSLYSSWYHFLLFHCSQVSSAYLLIVCLEFYLDNSFGIRAVPSSIANRANIRQGSNLQSFMILWHH